MKKRTFWIIESIMIAITLIGFIAYGVLRGFGYQESAWTSCCLALGILGLFIFTFLFFMKLFNSSSLPETKQGIICPRCHYINEEGSDICKQCGHKLKEEEEEKQD